VPKQLDTLVEVEGCRGDWFDLTNGDEGIYLATKLDGFYDPPIKVFYEEPGNLPGSRHLGDRILRRDLSFGVEILNDPGDGNWLSRDSLWRKNWSASKVTKIYITTEESGTRHLNCRLGESPEVNMDTDPNMNVINRTSMIVYAGDPFWWGEDKVFTVETKKDTQFEPTLFDIPGVWPWEELPKEELTITVDASHGGVNPTDQDIYPIWTLPGSPNRITDFPWPFPPGIPVPWERAPFTQFVIPDYNWDLEGYPENGAADRRVQTPGLIYGENVVINTDPAKEQIVSEMDTPVWERMNGVRWRNHIPAWTEKCTFKITASGCPAGQVISLSLPRPWSRPWGLE
jgi:hypothetical protein